MPRSPLNQEQKRDYKLKDFKKWVSMQMASTGKTQADVGKALGISQGRVSQMLKQKGKKVKKDPFSYGQVLTLCDFFGADEKEKGRLLTL